MKNSFSKNMRSIIGMWVSLLCTLGLLVIFASVAWSAVPAFPGAEGYGAQTPGGRGGKVFEVINLNDSGPGSLRAAIEATGRRIVVFRTGGTISLSSPLAISNPYITIAGQTAPGGGITIKANGRTGIRIYTHDIIIRYLTIRVGSGGQTNAILIANNGSNDVHDIVVDHSSMSWATDEIFTTWYRAHRVTAQWNIISENLRCSTHPEGCHSKGSMLGGYKFTNEDYSGRGGYDMSMHHNLIAHHSERAPNIQITGVCDIVNNVIYNIQWTSTQLLDRTPNYVSHSNVIKNYYKQGPSSTGSDKYEVKTYWAEPGGDGIEVYVEGNIGWHRTSDSDPENLIVDPGSRSDLVDVRHTAPSITETSAFDAYDNVLSYSGNYQGLNCSGNWYAWRDIIDTRIITNVQETTGTIIDNESDTPEGGWVIIDEGTPCTDSDHDGMPDEWENAKDLNPNIDDSAGYDLHLDYTNIEMFINSVPDTRGGVKTPTNLRIIRR